MPSWKWQSRHALASGVGVRSAGLPAVSGEWLALEAGPEEFSAQGESMKAGLIDPEIGLREFEAGTPMREVGGRPGGEIACIVALEGDSALTRSITEDVGIILRELTVELASRCEFESHDLLIAPDFRPGAAIGGPNLEIESCCELIGVVVRPVRRDSSFAMKPPLRYWGGSAKPGFRMWSCVKLTMLSGAWGEWICTSNESGRSINMIS